eukprot:gene8380-biopygen8349
MGEVEAALGVGEQRAALFHVRHLGLQQQAAFRHRQVFGVPLGVALGEAQAQGVMMFQHRQQRLLQAMRFQGLNRLQQQCLVPVLALRDVGVEEPVLDRRQPGRAGQHALFGADLLAAGRHGGQGLHGLVLEQITRAEMNPCLPGPADHLDRQDRVAAQLEEVVVKAYLLHVQYRAPDGRQGLLQLVARRHVLLTIRLGVRLRQGAAVEFAVGGQRHAVENDQVRGHHVVRQLRFQMRLEGFTQRALLLVADQIGHQLFAARGIQRQHHCFTHRLVFQQAGFNFPQLDAEPANLHLMVDTTEVFHQAIGTLAHQVTGAIQATAVRGKRIRDKPLRRHPRTLVIPLGKACTADVQLAGRALRHQRQIRIQNVGHTRADDAADRHAAGALFQDFRGQAGQRHHHGFSRAIGVEKQRRLECRANALQVFAGQGLTAGDAHAHRQGLVLRGQPLRQLAAIAWGEAQDIDAVPTNQPADFFRVPLALGPQHNLGTTEQRHQQTLGGSVKVDGIEVQLAVIRAHAEALDHRLAMHGDFAVGHHHALGLAGGTGGVDQVGLMLRQADERQLACRVVRQGRQVIFQAPAADTLRQFAQCVEHRGIAEQQADATVFDHVVQAVQRVFRVQRHIGAAGLEDCQQANHHLQRTRQRQADPHLRAHAALAEHPGQAIGAAVEFAVAQGLPGKGQRRCIGTGQGLLAEQVMDALVEAMLASLNAEAVSQGALFASLQQRQLTQALLRIGEQGFQQVLPMRRHARNARLVEQVGAVGQAATQAMIEVSDFQVEVELGGAGVVGQVFDGHPGQGAALLEFPALHVAHHLEQRVVRRAAGWLQGFHQVVERQVLMGLAFDHGVANLVKQFADTHLPVELATQHLGVEKCANQPFAFRANPVGHRRTDAQVSLAAVAVEQYREGGGHGHEQGQAAFGVEGTHAGGEVVTQIKTVQLALVTLHRRPRTVGRQFQQRMFGAQLRGPVIQLALAFAGLQPLALPHAVVEVLHRQWRQWRFAVVDERFVQRAEFTGKDVHGPAFGDDMVQGQHQVMFLLAGLDQAGAQQWTGLQIERRVGFMIGQLLHTPLPLGLTERREILPIHAHAGLRRNLLLRHAIDARESRAQGFMTHDQGLQRRLETAHVQHPAKARHAADVIRRAVGLHLPEEPHALLGIGQWHRLAAVDLADGQLLVTLPGGLDQPDLLGESPQLAGVEQRAQRQFDVTGLAGAGDDLRRQQRMATKGEEAVPQADAWQRQDFTPDRGDLLFQRCFRFDVLTYLPHRFRQGAAIQFAAWAQGHRVQAHQLRRDHVLRQLGGQGGFYVLFIQRFAGGVVTDQLRTGCGFPHQHHRLGDAVESQQAGFDFFRLDTEATQFDLLIQAPEVFQHTLGAPAHAVTGAIQACARLAQRVGDKAFGGQPRTPEVTPGQADATDAQLTRHTRRQRLELIIQHPANHIAQRPANRRTLAVLGLAMPVRHVDRGFGGAIPIVQLHRRQLRQHPVAQLGRQRFTAGEQATQAGAFGSQRFVDKQLQQRRHKVQGGHAVLLHQLSDAMGIAMLAGAGQHQAATGDQRPETLPHRHVETDGRLLHQHIGFVQLVGGLHPLQALGQRGMSVAHALGLAGGAGGVDHVGEVVAIEVQTRRVGRPTVELEAVHGDDAHALRRGQLFQQWSLGQQQLHAAVLEHVAQAFGGIIRVQRHIGAAGLDDCQQADQQLRRTLGGDGHAHVRADALVPQVMGQAVGLGVQLREGQTAVLPHQCGAFRDVLVEVFRQPALRRCARRSAPLLLLALLVDVQQLQVADGLLRLFADGLQQVDEVPGQALDGGGVEQLIGVVEGQAQAPVAVFFSVQLQVELGFAAVPCQLVGKQARQAAQGAEVTLLVVEHHLEQALFPSLGEGFQQLFERQVLMGLGTQRCGAGCRQQLGEGQARIQFGAQYEGVDKEPDQALGFLARTVGVGHADADIALAAVAIEQALERREQQHERRGFVALGSLANGFAEARAHTHTVTRGTAQVLRRTRVIGGQAQGWVLVAQLLFPVSQLPLALAFGQPLALPTSVVGVLQGQRWQFQGLALGRSGVQSREFVDQHVERPAVRDDVVHRHQQLVVFVIQAHQRYPQQRAFLQVELGAGFVFTNLLGTGFPLGGRQIAEVDDLQIEISLGVDPLEGLAIALEEARAQGFVALDQLLEA